MHSIGGRQGEEFMRFSLSLIFFLLLPTDMFADPVAPDDRAMCPNGPGAQAVSGCNDRIAELFASFFPRPIAPTQVGQTAEPTSPAPRPSGAAEGTAANDNAICENWKNAAELAIAACGRLIASSNLSPRELSNAYWRRGLALSAGKAREEARFDIEQAIKADPTNDGPFFTRGYFYFFQASDFPRAIGDFSQAIRNNSRFEAAYGLRGQAYEKTGQFARALADYRGAVAIFPADPEATAGIRRMEEKLAAIGEAELPVQLPRPSGFSAAPPRLAPQAPQRPASPLPQTALGPQP
jgi:tetratricopeptide (TPR) repeat protein